MKNIHTIFSNWSDIHVLILEKFGINISKGYSSFTIEEGETYLELKPYLDKWNVSNYVVSKFSVEEENHASRLVLFSPWANGYPMPDNDNSFKRTTYDDADYCSSCGIGLSQKKPFCLKNAPNWHGHKGMFSLNWVFDELFVRKDIYERIFKPIDIKSKEVLLYKKETVIDDTVQIIVPVTEIPLNLEGYPYHVCKDCNRKRYDLINKGFFPSFKTDVCDLQIFKSSEWFGTGASARKYIFVSQALRQEFLKNKIRATYIPCE